MQEFQIHESMWDQLFNLVLCEPVWKFSVKNDKRWQNSKKVAFIVGECHSIILWLYSMWEILTHQKYVTLIIDFDTVWTTIFFNKNAKKWTK